MKYFLKFCIPCILLVTGACSSHELDTASNVSSYNISGQLTSTDTGTVYLLKAGDYLGYTFEKVDSTRVQGGEFTFEGNLEYPELHYLSTQTGAMVSLF